jgi:enamine deaminase RidA (YjgF/YER057c/UK114 family)
VSFRARVSRLTANKAFFTLLNTIKNLVSPAVAHGENAVTTHLKEQTWMSQPTHTRIRMFNTKETYPNQSLDNDLCQVVRAGNTVYVRGQIGTDFEGNLVGLGDPRAQAEQAMKNVKQLLEEAGSDLSHIVKTTTYLIDPRYREPVYQEVGKWLKGVFPISTGLVVSGLGQPEWLMEIDVIAVIPE